MEGRKVLGWDQHEVGAGGLDRAQAPRPSLTSTRLPSVTTTGLAKWFSKGSSCRNRVALLGSLLKSQMPGPQLTPTASEPGAEAGHLR